LKERNQERAEVTRAATQADDAEQKHATLLQEIEKVKRNLIAYFPGPNCVAKIQMRTKSITETKDLQQELQQLKSDKEELVTQLEEAQFRVAEESINRADVEVRH